VTLSAAPLSMAHAGMRYFANQLPEYDPHTAEHWGLFRKINSAVATFLAVRPRNLLGHLVRLEIVQQQFGGADVPSIRQARRRAHELDVELIVDCGGGPDVNGDPAMLRQAFLNLALNACQAMPNGGTLRIRCESVRGRRVAISFSDTGVGIAPADLQRIFDLYFTTKEKGSGIGLSMVYRTVQMHDGEIEVQSTPGAGTTFRLLLPQA
jgi:signal transduction histidine kinase